MNLFAPAPALRLPLGGKGRGRCRLALGQVLALAWLLGASLLSSAQAACTQMRIGADPAYPPLHWFDGRQMQGASIDIARRVLDELQIPYEVRHLGPFTRVMKLAERGELDMVATLKKTPEREQFLLFPKTPALSNPVAVFQARDRAFSFQGRQDLVGHRGGITRGNRFGADVDDFARASLDIEEADTPESNFNKLKVGRIEYFLTGYFVGMAYLLKRSDEASFVVPATSLADTPNYRALTLRGACADRLDAIDAKLAQLKKSGVLDEIIKANLTRWRSSSLAREGAAP
jgi:polar amino acid transport system substrate-binding protein